MGKEREGRKMCSEITEEVLQTASAQSWMTFPHIWGERGGERRGKGKQGRGRERERRSKGEGEKERR